LSDSNYQCSLVQLVVPHPMQDQVAVMVYLDQDLVHLLVEYSLSGVVLVAHLGGHVREIVLHISLSLKEWSGSSYS
jgi:hypothetical protein